MSRPKETRAYSSLVAQLLTLGVPSDGEGDGSGGWRAAPPADYGAMGIGPEHVPELIVLLTDREMLEGPDPLWCGPVHAARALCAMGESSAARALIDAVRLADRLDMDAWLEDLSDRHGMARLGPAIWAPASAAVRDQREAFGFRIFLLAALEQLVTQPEHAGEFRPRFVALRRELLKTARFNDPAFNGSVISHLVKLGASEALPDIEAAFASPERTRPGGCPMGGVDRMSYRDFATARKDLLASPADRLRQRIGWAESSLVELKRLLAEPDPEPPADDDQEAQDGLDRTKTEGYVLRQEERLAELRRELAELERATG